MWCLNEHEFNMECNHRDISATWLSNATFFNFQLHYCGPQLPSGGPYGAPGFLTQILAHRALLSLSLSSSAGKGRFLASFFKTTYIVLVNLQKVAGSKKFLELLLEAVNFTGYCLIRRTLMVQHWMLLLWVEMHPHYSSILWSLIEQEHVRHEIFVTWIQILLWCIWVGCVTDPAHTRDPTISDLSLLSQSVSFMVGIAVDLVKLPDWNWRLLLVRFFSIPLTEELCIMKKWPFRLCFLLDLCHKDAQSYT